MACSQTYDPWPVIVRRFLGKKMQQNVCKHIQLDFLIVDVGWKPAFLYDYGAVSAEDIVQMLGELRQKKLLKSDLQVLVINMDKVVYNKKALKLHREMVEDVYKFLVDVSPSCAEPRLVQDENLLSQLMAFVKRILSSSDTLIEVQNLENLNITSLYGILLGFPVVYWYNNDDRSGDNCLSMEPLDSYKLQGSTSSSGSSSRLTHNVYAFSIPTRLRGDLERIIHSWTECMTSHPGSTVIFENVQLVRDQVRLPVVTL